MNLADFVRDISAVDVLHIRVSGDCMEGADIHDGDIVELDLRHMPRPPVKGSKAADRDVCVCYGVMPGTISPVVMCKSYVGKFGFMQLVGTQYANREGEPFRMNNGFEPLAIFGVVAACYDGGMNLRWRKDTSDHPESLPTESTITGDNIGAPIAIRSKPNLHKEEPLS